MDDQALWAELKAVFASVFGRNDFELSPETTAADISYWDSLNHVQLILEVEKHFKIRFKHAEVAAFENVGDLFTAIHKRVQQAAG